LAEGVSLEMPSNTPPCFYCLILLAGIVPFVVFNDNFYLVTIFVVLFAGAEAADKATSGHDIYLTKEQQF
jgi:formate hydrogenlyase subunit 3/multisubunit Na+/H+ antiporter MnhD subunit